MNLNVQNWFSSRVAFRNFLNLLIFLLFLASDKVWAGTNTITFDNISGAAVGLNIQRADICTYFINATFGTCIDPAWCPVMFPAGIAPGALGAISSDPTFPYQASFALGTQIIAVFTDPVISVSDYYFVACKALTSNIEKNK